ncbi:hypothetical protein B0H14DRAFT_2611500 [Mycena olivaceomarginata]|nr:hypothetical protein B0H14DRAFT_2611500 [Mycena olivaceomarginata]
MADPLPLVGIEPGIESFALKAAVGIGMPIVNQILLFWEANRSLVWVEIMEKVKEKGPEIVTGKGMFVDSVAHVANCTAGSGVSQSKSIKKTGGRGMESQGRRRTTREKAGGRAHFGGKNVTGGGRIRASSPRCPLARTNGIQY